MRILYGSWRHITTGLLFICLFWPAYCPAGEVTLAWDANSETNLAGYKLYYDGDSDSELYGGTDAAEGTSPIVIYREALEDADAPTFTVTGLTSGEYYYFALTAFNTDGLESDFSDEVGALIDDDSDDPSFDASVTDPSGTTSGSSGEASGGGCFISDTMAGKVPLFPVAAAAVALFLAAISRPARHAARACGDDAGDE